MKAVQWIFNGVMILALAYLFFTKDQPEEPKQEEPKSITENVGDTESYVIRYINSDTLYKEYKLVQDRFNDLEKKQQQYSNNLDYKVNAFKKEVEEFQQAAASMSQFEGQMKQKELMQKEQELAQLQQDLSSKLLDMEQQMLMELRGKVIKKLEEFKLEGVDLILDHSGTSSLLVANDSLDITQEVLEYLNTEYINSKTQD